MPEITGAVAHFGFLFALWTIIAPIRRLHVLFQDERGWLHTIHVQHSDAFRRLRCAIWHAPLQALFYVHRTPQNLNFRNCDSNGGVVL